MPFNAFSLPFQCAFNGSQKLSLLGTTVLLLCCALCLLFNDFHCLFDVRDCFSLLDDCLSFVFHWLFRRLLAALQTFIYLSITFPFCFFVLQRVSCLLMIFISIHCIVESLSVFMWFLEVVYHDLFIVFYCCSLVFESAGRFWCTLQKRTLWEVFENTQKVLSLLRPVANCKYLYGYLCGGPGFRLTVRPQVAPKRPPAPARPAPPSAPPTARSDRSLTGAY